MTDNAMQRRVRSFSSSNLHATRRIHEYIANQEKGFNHEVNLRKDVTKSSMIIPTLGNMQGFNPKLPSYTLQLVADTPTLVNLEDHKIINWCPYARTLLPLNVESDGNCLLHSVSVYIWGVHDRSLNLRRYLHRRLRDETKFEGSMYLRWKHEQKQLFGDLTMEFSTVEMQKAWDDVVFTASEVEHPRGNQGLKYFPLEDIHVFALSNIIARPVVVLSEDTYHGPGGKSLQPNNMGGIYLPLLRNAADCEKSPVIIGYWNGHFMPLISGEDEDMVISKRQTNQGAQHCLPLVDKNYKPLPLKFMLPTDSRHDLVYTYLDCFHIQSNYGQMPAALIRFRSPPAWSIELMWSLFSKAKETFCSFAQTNPAPFLNKWKPSDAFSESNNETTAIKDRDLLSHGTEPLISQVLPRSSGAVNPCLNYQSGCRNIGEQKFKNLCKDCYALMNTHTVKMPEKSEAYVIPASTVMSTEVHPKLQRKITPLNSQSKKCIISGCTGKACSATYDLCRECHSTRFGKESQSYRELKEDKVASSQPQEYENAAKTLCESPGCQEEIVRGTGRCRIHLNESVNHKCVTDECNNRAVDNQCLLCDECLENQRETTFVNDRRHQINFKPPEVYPAFDRVPTSSVHTIAAQKSYEVSDTPYWHSAYEKTGLCRETLCDNFAAPGKEGLCNECSKFKLILNESEKSGQKCRKPSCRNHGQPDFDLFCHSCYYGGQSQGMSVKVPKFPGAGVDTISSETRYLDDQLLNRLQIDDKEVHSNQNGMPRPSTELHTYGNIPYNPDQLTQPSSSQSGIVNLGYDASLYSMIQREQTQSKCLTDGCRNQGKFEHKNLCESCYEKALLQEQQILKGNEERRMAQSRNEKLPADSPYLNPKPCKTRGCPHLSEHVGQGYCERCLQRMGREPGDGETVGGRRRQESPTAYPAGYQTMNARDPVRQQVMPKETHKCAKPFCEFYASGEFGPYCSKCFMELTKDDVTGSLNADSDVQSLLRGRNDQFLQMGRGQFTSADGHALLCRRRGCDLYGSPERNGYCSQCYNKSGMN